MKDKEIFWCWFEIVSFFIITAIGLYVAFIFIGEQVEAKKAVEAKIEQQNIILEKVLEKCENFL